MVSVMVASPVRNLARLGLYFRTAGCSKRLKGCCHDPAHARNHTGGQIRHLLPDMSRRVFPEKSSDPTVQDGCDGSTRKRLYRLPASSPVTKPRFVQYSGV